MAHTPTPWYLEITPSALWIGVEKAAGGKVGDIVTSLDVGEEYNPWYNDQAKANAAFIVLAVNSHDALVEALTWALGQMSKPTLIRRQNSGYFASYEAAVAALALAHASQIGGSNV